MDSMKKSHQPFRPASRVLCTKLNDPTARWLAWLLALSLLLVWSVIRALAADPYMCSGDERLKNSPKPVAQSHADLPPGAICQLAQSSPMSYGQPSAPQWEQAPKVQVERVERTRFWEEYRQSQLCKRSCYETYRTCIRRRWDPRNQSCQQDFDNCIQTCQ